MIIQQVRVYDKYNYITSIKDCNYICGKDKEKDLAKGVRR